jgi:2-dehydropantoate 2-reductase
MPAKPFEMQNPVVLIIGSGSVGTLVGWNLSRGGATVISLVRSADDSGRRTIHQLDGSTQTWTPDQVTQDAGEIDKVDLIIIAIQGMVDVELADRIRSLVTPDMPVVTLMNGLGHKEVLTRLLPEALAVTGAAHVAVHRVGRDHVVVHQRGGLELAIPHDQSRPAALDAVIQVLLRGGLPTQLGTDVEEVIWRKLLFNTPITGLSLLNPNQTLGWILNQPEFHSRIRRIQQELLDIAEHEQIAITQDDADRMLVNATALPNYTDIGTPKQYGIFKEAAVLFENPARVGRSAGCSVRELTSIIDEMAGGGIRAADKDRHRFQGRTPEPEGTLTELIDRTCEVHADQQVRDTRKTMNYRELGVAIREVASTMTPGNRVGLLAETGIDFMVGFLGGFYGGAIMVPLDPEHPPAHLADLARASGIVDLLVDDTDSNTKERLKVLEISGRVIRIREEGREQSAPVSGGAQILMTSGSTGQPKPVLQQESTILNSALRHMSVLETGPRDRIAAMNSPEVSGTSRDIFLAMISGAGISFRRISTLGPQGALAWMRDEAITIHATVASLFRAAVDASPEGHVPSLRAIKITGEPIKDEDVRRFERVAGDGARLHAGLSSTELLLATEYIMEKGEKIPRQLPIGWGIDPIKVAVVDDSGTPLPDGVPGRIAYVGAHLRSEDSGWGHISDDIALSDNGLLWHLGRSDGMIKVAGNRVDLGEPEHHALRQPGTSEATAFTFLREGRTLLGLAVVAESNADLSPEGLREALLKVMPRSIVPQRIILVDEIPRLQTMKPDRKSLTELVEAELMEHDQGSEGPETGDLLDERANRVLEITRELGGIRGLHYEESYFEAGGDSISLIRVITKLENTFSVALPFSLLEREPSARMLLESIEKRLTTT